MMVGRKSLLQLLLSRKSARRPRRGARRRSQRSSLVTTSTSPKIYFLECSMNDLYKRIAMLVLSLTAWRVNTGPMPSTPLNSLQRLYPDRTCKCSCSGSSVMRQEPNQVRSQLKSAQTTGLPAGRPLSRSQAEVRRSLRERLTLLRARRGLRQSPLQLKAVREARKLSQRRTKSEQLNS